MGGQTLLGFGSNDYLGLASHPQVAQAFRAGVEQYGIGAGASHLVDGHTTAHHRLEQELARFVGAPRALLFSTGYMANLGVIHALAGRRSVICADRLNHASLIDAAVLSRARLRRYPHRDPGRLEKWLAGDRAGLIVTDGLFSMDGDLAPLDELSALARRFDAWLYVDDAHGLGVLGAGGRGCFEHLGVARAEQTVLMGTLGKAFGVFGAFVAGSEALIETLIQRARTYLYTTALPPAVAEAARAALAVAQTEGWRRQWLAARVTQFRAGLRKLGFAPGASTTPIQPLVVGDARRALAASAALQAQGIFVPAIRPPTVAEGSARLRVTFSAAHTEADVAQLLDALAGLKGMLRAS